ncbi:MAG: cell surface protein SprA [Bacteroidetes bacterium]|nr:cell surface protein SprA [Bacteroidota bacterium]
MNLERILKGTIFSIGIVAVGAAVASSALVINLPMVPPAYEAPVAPPDSGKKDTLKYPFKDRVSDVYSLPYDNSPLYLGDPSNITTTIDYDPATNEYNINERVGNQFYRNPNYMTFQEYVDDQNKKSTQAYWKQLAEGANIVSQKKGFNPKLYVPGKLFETIFGGNSIDIRPQGSVELRFGLQSNRNDNPALPEKQRKVTTFDFNQKIQLNVVGNIGTKLKTAINYNTEASFEFENRMKLEFTGGEDDILKKLEAGNVTLPLNGTLIQGSQSLFGIKAQLQFGHLTVTSIFSQQKGKTSTIEVKGGAQTQQYELTCDNYEANRHFFLAQYFRDNYDAAMRNIPVIQSPVTITKIEVWIVKPGQIDTRALIGLADAGESNPSNTNFLTPGVSPLPGNDANSLYSTLNAPPYNQLRNVGFANFNILNQLNMVAPKDYERIDNAVKLNPNEYTFNPRLGFISLRSSLNPNQVLAVAYEYQVNGKLYRVGDLTNSGVNPQDRMYVKMLKSSNLNVTLPIWDLMMKNVYNIGAYGVQPKDFKLNILFFDDSTGTNINFLPVSATQPKLFGKPLLRVLNLDRLNSQNDPQPDGVFDYVEGLTINSSDGRVYIPVVEPFGKSLQALFTDSASASKYMYQELYDQTKVAAQQITEKINTGSKAPTPVR